MLSIPLKETMKWGPQMVLEATSLAGCISSEAIRALDVCSTFRTK